MCIEQVESAADWLEASFKLYEPPAVPESPVELRQRLGEAYAGSKEQTVGIDETVFYAASMIGAALRLAACSQAALQKVEFEIAAMRPKESRENVVRLDAAHRKLLGAWLGMVEPGLRSLAAWRKECKSIGFNLSAWDDLAIDAHFRRKALNRLVAKRDANTAHG